MKKDTRFKKGHNTWNKGKKGVYSEEYRNKLSSSHRGKKFSISQKEKISRAMLGKRNALGAIRSEEFRKNISKVHTGVPKTEEHKKKTSEAFKGNKSHFWEGGKSYEEYGSEFNEQLRKEIRIRDNYQCQECFKDQNEERYKLNVHHIDYDKRNNRKDNLVTLCLRCHLKTNFDREGWINYFKDKL